MRFQVLDSWRGMAALLVALFHFRFLGHFYEFSFVRNGWLWVDFFFVLSGFVITHAYRERLRSVRGIAYFAIRRFGRLWPLHAAILAIFLCFESLKWALIKAGVLENAIPAFAAGSVYSVPSLITNLLLVQSLGFHDGLTWNTPSWSISTEFYACLAFALACVLPRRMFKLTVAIAMGASFAMVAQSGSYLNTTYDFGFFRCVLGFLAGHVTYSAFQMLRQSGKTPSTPLEAGALIATVLFVSMLGYGASTLAAPLVFSAVVLVFASEGGHVSALLARKPFQKLGEWSYSIYMVHMLVFMVASRGLLAAERATGRQLRIEHQHLSDPAPIDVFFFRTKSPWTPRPLAI